MATIDIGKIKQVWRGTYASGTAYTPDDVVEYTDSGIVSSYICVANTTGNAPSSSGTAHGSWNYLAKGGAAGADGTDVGAALSNNQIAYKNNSGSIAGLSIGSAGQALKVNSGANGYEFGAVAGGKVGQITSFTQRAVQSATSYAAFHNAIPNFAHSITPSATSSKILVEMDFVWGDSDWVQFALYSKATSGGSYSVVTNAIASATGGGNRLAGTTANGYGRGHNNSAQQMSMSFLDTPNTTSEMFYTLYFASHGNHAQYLNRSYDDGNYATIGRQVSTITLTEVLA